MIMFAIVFFGLVLITLLIQVLSNIRLVGGNELGIVSGGFSRRGFKTFAGGRVFHFPLFQQFSTLDLASSTIEVVAEAAMAIGIVPLDVKASVSFAISSDANGRARAVTRVLEPAKNRESLERIAGGIIEGRLREAVAAMTTERLMSDKHGLAALMKEACKADLEELGLEITTLNIVDVADHDLGGKDGGDLYIELLRRVQAVDAETQARRARAEEKALSDEQAEARRAETVVKRIQDELESLRADIRLHLAREDHRRAVECERAASAAKARLAGVKAEAEAEKLKAELEKNRCVTELLIPAKGAAENAVLEAKIELAHWLNRANAELEELEVTLKTLETAGAKADRAWLLENIDTIFAPYAETLANYPVEHLTVMTGGGPRPSTAIYPSAAASARDELAAEALGLSKTGGDVGKDA